MPSAVIFGAGNIGRGFIGQLFSESRYEVNFVDVDETLIGCLNERKAYQIHLVSNERTEVVEVGPVRAFHAQEKDAIADVLAEAKVAATAVGARALPSLAPLVTAGVMRREKRNIKEPLNILLCENLKDAAAVFRNLVLEQLPKDVQQFCQEYVGFVDTVIGRMVPPPTPEMRAQDPTYIAVEPYKELPVDKSAWKGEVPSIVGLQACDNFAAYTARKLYVHNCGHACLAYWGFLKGYTYGYEALADKQIAERLDEALSESIQGIVAAHGVQRAWLEEHKRDLLTRFANRALGDTIIRLGRDPIRKLAPKDRLIGAAHLAEGCGVKPSTLAFGIAAGYCFDAKEDEIAVSLQQMISELGIEETMNRVSGLTQDQPLTQMVIEHYHRIKQGKAFEEG